MDGKLVLRSATFRAHLKDCARILSANCIGKVQGEKTFASKVLNGVYHDEAQQFTPVLKEERHALCRTHGQLREAGPRHRTEGHPHQRIEEY